MDELSDRGFEKNNIGFGYIPIYMYTNLCVRERMVLRCSDLSIFSSAGTKLLEGKTGVACMLGFIGIQTEMMME